MTRAPARKRRGPGLRVEKHHLPTGSSGCRIRTCRRQRCGVRGPHKRDRRPPLVRWKLRCPRRSRTASRRRAIQRCSCPPFPLLPIAVLLVVPSAGVGAPRDFMAPCTCDGLSCQASPETSIGPPALTWNYVRVLRSTSTCLALLRAVMPTSHCCAERATERRPGPA